MPANLVDKLTEIERTERSILETFAKLITDGCPLYSSTFFLFGVLKRTVALSDGFRTHVAVRNFTCAASLLRMQVDTALRVFAATLVADPEAYAKDVFDGMRVDRLKDANGERMTDSYLVRRLSRHHPWVEGVYKDTCNFVHFTNRHIFTSITNLNDTERTANFSIGAKDPPRPESDYFEVVDAFFESMKLTANLAISWQVATMRPRGKSAA